MFSVGQKHHKDRFERSDINRTVNPCLDDLLIITHLSICQTPTESVSPIQPQRGRVSPLHHDPTCRFPNFRGRWISELRAKIMARQRNICGNTTSGSLVALFATILGMAAGRSSTPSAAQTGRSFDPSMTVNREHRSRHLQVRLQIDISALHCWRGM